MYRMPSYVQRNVSSHNSLPFSPQELPNFRTPKGGLGQCMRSKCMGSRVGSSSPTGKGKSIVNSQPDKENSTS